MLQGRSCCANEDRADKESRLSLFTHLLTVPPSIAIRDSIKSHPQKFGKLQRLLNHEVSVWRKSKNLRDAAISHTTNSHTTKFPAIGGKRAKNLGMHYVAPLRKAAECMDKLCSFSERWTTSGQIYAIPFSAESTKCPLLIRPKADELVAVGTSFEVDDVRAPDVIESARALSRELEVRGANLYPIGYALLDWKAHWASVSFGIDRLLELRKVYDPYQILNRGVRDRL